MVIKEGTPGKYKLRAVEPRSRRPLIEKYPTQGAVAARRAALEQAGYSVLVTLNEDEFLTARSGAGDQPKMLG
jgi:hypothetical protein